MATASLKKFVYLSIAAAVATITIKYTAYLLTNSVGLLSDALESCVNLVAAIVALIMLNLAGAKLCVTQKFSGVEKFFYAKAPRSRGANKQDSIL